MKLFLLLSILFFSSGKGFHDFTVPLANGQEVKLKTFKGKKVLIVNIASASSHVEQLKRLAILYQRHKSDLVIIAIPSDSFGSEPLDDSAISELLASQYGVTYLIAAKSSVTGADQLPLFQWLANGEANGVTDIPMVNNFQKTLVNGEGRIIGIFSTDEDPMGASVLRTLTEN